MNPDGISYLDIGDAYLRGDWKTAANGYWSPLYPWVLGLTLWLLAPSRYWEFPVVHGVNFVLYLVALATFTLLLLRLRPTHAVTGSSHEPGHGVPLPEALWLILGYVVFTWSSLELIGTSRVGPDMLVAATVYATATIVTAIAGDAHVRPLRYALLGLVFGIGYLVKTPVVMIAVVFLIVALAVRPISVRRLIGGAFATMIAFLLVAGPYIVFNSLQREKFTIGESGPLNYAWVVNRAPSLHWRVDPAGNVSRSAQMRLEDPPVYVFDRPGRMTYPLWYDPSYWYDGPGPRFDLRQQLRALASPRQASVYASALFGLYGSIAFGIALLLVMSERVPSTARRIGRQWRILAPAAVGALMYWPVSVELRYIGPFVVLAWLGLAAAVRLSPSPESTRLVGGVAVIICASFVMTVVPSRALDLAWNVKTTLSGQFRHEDSDVAEALARLGIRPGDKLGILARPLGRPAEFLYWARLARASIAAEISSRHSTEFWLAEPAVRQRAIGAFRDAGIKAIVDRHAPTWASNEGWQRVGGTPYHVRMIAQSTASQ